MYTQRGLESVGLVGWISGLELGSSSILVGQKNPIAGIGRRRWCFDVSLGDSKGYYSNKDQKGQIEVKSHELPGRNETEVRNGNAQGIFWYSLVEAEAAVLLTVTVFKEADWISWMCIGNNALELAKRKKVFFPLH